MPGKEKIYQKDIFGQSIEVELHPVTSQMTEAIKEIYANPELRKSLSVIDREIIVCIIGALSRIQASLRIANNVGLQNSGVIGPVNLAFYKKCMSQLSDLLDALSKEIGIKRDGEQ